MQSKKSIRTFDFGVQYSDNGGDRGGRSTAAFVCHDGYWEGEENGLRAFFGILRKKQNTELPENSLFAGCPDWKGRWKT